MQLELIQQLEGDMVWSQFYQEHGEGWQHIEFVVTNYDEVMSAFEKHGGKCIYTVLNPEGKCVSYVETPEGIVFAFSESGFAEH